MNNCSQTFLVTMIFYNLNYIWHRLLISFYAVGLSKEKGLCKWISLLFELWNWHLRHDYLLCIYRYIKASKPERKNEYQIFYLNFVKSYGNIKFLKKIYINILLWISLISNVSFHVFVNGNDNRRKCHFKFIKNFGCEKNIKV